MKEKFSKERISLMIEVIILFLIISDIVLLTSLFFVDVTPEIYTIIVIMIYVWS